MPQHDSVRKEWNYARRKPSNTKDCSLRSLSLFPFISASSDEVGQEWTTLA